MNIMQLMLLYKCSSSFGRYIAKPDLSNLYSNFHKKMHLKLIKDNINIRFKSYLCLNSDIIPIRDLKY